LKELDFKTLHALLEKEINLLNLRYILVFIVLNIIIGLINFFIQRNVKFLDSNIYKKKVREDRRIIIIEKIYQDLVQFTYILSHVEIKSAINDLSKLENYISLNKLYISKELNDKIIAFTDYLKNIISDFRKKDYAVELKLLNDIENEFNK